MKNISTVFGSVAAAALLVSASVIPSLAQAQIGLGVNAGLSASTSVNGSGAGANVGVNAGANLKASSISRAQARADEEIDRRIKALNALTARVNAMVKLSADQKNSLSSIIQTQIGAMNTLRSQVDADAGAQATTSLKTDIQSITKSYRIYMLIIPQGAIMAASDRVMDVGGLLGSLAGKIQERISTARSQGMDVSAETTALADMNAKIADANAQAQAAVSATANLKPDNGDATVKAANDAALKDARTKIQAAQQDLVAARKDAGTIVKALAALKVSASATTSASGSVNQ